ncbi:Bifunctional protein GlmU [Frankliniella fusca]|uniref:Bifunctional protein GlmU n=1 Tax=Frankliniella fusca TaxID=407009 RepID=A0AAE1LLT4_9NEOP|nr:Bifunctional protein GlmU [Frankliniella fusca]
MEHVVLKPSGEKRMSITLPVSSVQLGTGPKTLQQQVREIPSNFSSARIFKLPPGVVLVKPTLGAVGGPVLSKQQGPLIQLEARRLVPIQPKLPPRIVPNPDFNPEKLKFNVQPKPIPKIPTDPNNKTRSKDLKENKEQSTSANGAANDSPAQNSSDVASDGSDTKKNLKPKPTPWQRDPRPLWKSKEPIVMYSGCSKEDLEEAEKRKRKKELPPESLPCPKVLQDILPTLYKYHISSFEELRNPEHFKAEIRTAFTTKEEALQWLKDFEDVSGTNFRITKTFKENSLRIIFKKCYKCHKNTFRKGQQQSKRHLGCEARLSLTIKNPGMKSSADPLLSDFPCVIGIHHNHCHSLKTPDGLRHRRTLPEIREKFADMFRAKITPAAALRVHKADLKREYGDRYEEVVNDGAKCPPLPWCYRLYYEICGKKVKDGKKKSTRRSYSSSKKKVFARQNQQSSSQGSTTDSVLVDFNPENCLADTYALDNSKVTRDDALQRSINSLYDYEFMSKNNVVGEDELSKGVPSNGADVVGNNPELVDTAAKTGLVNPDEIIYQNETTEDYSDPGVALDEDDSMGVEETSDILGQDNGNKEKNYSCESEGTLSNNTECSIMELKQGLSDFCTYLINRVTNRPQYFLPAVESFISTFNRICETASDMQLAEEFSKFGKSIKEPEKQVTSDSAHAGTSSIVGKAQKHKLLEPRAQVPTLVEGPKEQNQSLSIVDRKPETLGSPPKRKVLVLRMKPNKFHQILGKVEEKRLQKGVINI